MKTKYTYTYIYIHTHKIIKKKKIRKEKSERPVFMITSGEAVQLIYRWKSQV